MSLGLDSRKPGESAPSIVELDLLELDSPALIQQAGPGTVGDESNSVYLQYTSGSTCTPAGVMVSNKNVFANFEQLMAGYFAPTAMLPRQAPLCVVAAVLSRHGFFVGIILPILSGIPPCSRARCLLAEARPMAAIDGKQYSQFFGGTQFRL